MLLMIVEISFMVFELSSNIFGGLLDEFGSSFSFFRCFFPPILDVPFLLPEIIDFLIYIEREIEIEIEREID